jgi:hypothetical protein
MIHNEDDDIVWVDSLDDFKTEGYFPFKCTSLLEFFFLREEIDAPTKKLLKAYAQDLVQKSIDLGRDEPLGMAAAMSAAKKYYNIPDKLSELTKANLLPTPFLHYCVLGSDGRYYFRLKYQMYSVDELFFYRKTDTFSGQDTAIENLREYVASGSLYILYTQQQVESVSECLKRLYKSYFNTEGKLDYRLYIKILEISLKLEDFRDNQKMVTGYKTAINQMETQIRDLWAKALIPKK